MRQNLASFILKITRCYVKFNDSFLWLKVRSQQKNENKRPTRIKSLVVVKKRARVKFLTKES